MKKNLIFGFHVIYHYLYKYSSKIKKIYINKNRNDIRIKNILNLSIKKKINIIKVNKKFLSYISKTKNHQGIVAKLKIIKNIDNIDNIINIINNSKKIPLLLILDSIIDHNNLGSCLRISECAGVNCIIASKNRSISLNSKSIKISSGASSLIPYILVKNLILCIKKLKKNGLKIIGMSEKSNKNLYELELSKPTAFIIGSENKGIRNLTKKYCDNLVKVPMNGVINSLNVSVLCGICLFETQRQRYFNL